MYMQVAQVYLFQMLGPTVSHRVFCIATNSLSIIFYKLLIKFFEKFIIF